jgi:hypothetical protein
MKSFLKYYTFNIRILYCFFKYIIFLLFFYLFFLIVIIMATAKNILIFLIIEFEFLLTT